MRDYEQHHSQKESLFRSPHRGEDGRHGRGSFTDGLVIATATSVRHAQSLADGISALCHEKKYEYLRMDGYTNGQWLLVDCNDVVVNIFQEATREMYNLEALWSVPSSREELRTMAAKAEKAE